MSATVLDMSISLDGFAAGPNVRVDNGVGDGGLVLHEWVAPAIGEDGPTNADRLSGVNAEVVAALLDTGAVVAGRGTVEPADYWKGDHHDGVPIFVLTRRDPATLPSYPGVTYLDDVTEAMARAKAAAGDRDVLVHGVTVARLALAAGVLDELSIHVVPVILGQGRPLFEDLPTEQIPLERVRVLHGEGGVTHIRYRVRR